jgi:ankyrin repeat protein
MNMEKACRLGNLKAIKELVAENPDVVNEVDEKIGWTPLYRTVICSHVDATKLLIKLGANPNIQNKLGEAPIHKAADSALPRIVKILLDAQADPNLQTNDGETPLHLATLR